MTLRSPSVGRLFSGRTDPGGRRAIAVALLGTASLALPTTAWADCVSSGSGTVTCSGTATGYTNSGAGQMITIQTGATVTGSIVIGNAGSVANAGTVNGGTGIAVNLGNDGQVTNSGTISSTGSGAVAVGDHGSVTNSGTITAVGGTPAAAFGSGGTFTNTVGATGAVDGNISFGPNLGSDVSTFTNDNVTYGIQGTLTASGSLNATNNGLFVGAISQVANGGNVSIVNGSAGNFSGYIQTGDQTVLTNNGIMSLTGISALGTQRATGSSFANNGTLTLGTSTAPTALNINGSFSQGSAGILNLSIIGSSGIGTPVGGSTYGQIHAIGAGGTASLGGTLNLVLAPGFYPTGSTYSVVLADQGVTGNFSTITGNSLPFITFVPTGIVTIAGSQQAYQFTAERTTTYAAAITPTATANQITIATAFEPLVNTATTTPTGAEATLVGSVDLLTIAQAETFFDQISPVGYTAFAGAIRDQLNNFSRQISLRTGDDDRIENHNGWWGTANYQIDVQSSTADRAKEGMLSLIGGYDINLPHYVLGGAFGFSSASVKYPTSAMSGHTNSYMLGGYGGLRFGGMRLDAQVDAELGNFSSTKTIALGYTTTAAVAATSTTAATPAATTASSTATATGSAGQHLVKATATLGYDFGGSRLILEPYVGIDASRGKISGFTETGAAAADLTVDSISANRTDLLAGAYVSTKSGHFRPYVRATYRSRLGSGGDPSVTASLDNDATTSFTLAGLPVGKQEADINAGVNVFFDPGGLIFVGYQGTIRKDLNAHGVNLGIRLAF